MFDVLIFDIFLFQIWSDIRIVFSFLDDGGAAVPIR